METDIKPLEFRRVTRWYGPVAGLLEVSFVLERGVTGLLGPNGAGKSTLIHIAAGLLRPGIGEARVFGLNPFKSTRARSRLGLLPETTAFPPGITARKFLVTCLNLSGIFGKEARARAGELLELAGLSGFAGKRIETFSKGMKQRLKLAQAIGHDPELLLLDEPLTALDPLARRQVIELVRSLGEKGRAVLVSSHILHEVEAMTDNIILLHHGRILAQGKVSDIRARLSDQPMRIWMGLNRPRAMAARIIEWPSVKAVEVKQDGLEAEITDVEGFYDNLGDVGVREENSIEELKVLDQGLEAVFDYLVG